ncbi:MAG TPA: ComEC/Rec2 family competence protein [Bacteroidia bacterium]|jgi:competence protein ComEC
MKIWNQAPLIRLLLPFIAGIISAVYFPFEIKNFWLIVLPYILFIAAVVSIPSLKISYKRSWIFGITINLLLFAFAYHLTIDKTQKLKPGHFSKLLADKKTKVRAVILQSPLEKEKTFKVILDVVACETNSGWKRSEGKVLLYLQKNEAARRLAYGDELLINTTFTAIPPPQNPGAFDYKRFLSFHNIYHQCYADSNSWVAPGINSGNPVLRYSYTLRDQLLAILRSHHIQNDEYAVGAALMLGYADKLDQDIISAYSSTGALHVLSVSGLHVAIVYVVFNWILFFLDKVKRGNIIKAAVLILLLWFYSALTGLSPSVLRAATMFSFIIIAKAFDRHTNIYNTLAASAFVLLAIDPFLIMEVGFQLSYIAVIGIVYIQPKIYSWYETDNWLLDQVWTITAVSIAAQIATFPLGLHYFHQFPNYFLLSNFIVIPLSTMIIYIGIALFVFAKISLIATYLALGFGWCVWLLNASVKLIEKWPCSLLKDISVNITETWLLYAMIVLFLLYFSKRTVNYLVLSLSMLLLILFSQIIEQHAQFHQRKLIIYNVPKTSAIDFISSKRNILYTDTVFAENENAQLFHIRHNWWELGVNTTMIVCRDTATAEVCIRNNSIQFFNKKIVRLDKQYRQQEYDFGKRIAIDLLIVSENADIKIRDILKVYQPGRIVFDSSNSAYKLKAWKNECLLHDRPFYSVTESGAFEMNI